MQTNLRIKLDYTFLCLYMGFVFLSVLFIMGKTKANSQLRLIALLRHYVKLHLIIIDIRLDFSNFSF